MTIEGLLQDKDAALRMRDTPIIIDEAGMVSARQMFELLALAAQNCNSRIIFSGDSRQIQSVEKRAIRSAFWKMNQKLGPHRIDRDDPAKGEPGLSRRREGVTRKSSSRLRHARPGRGDP